MLKRALHRIFFISVYKPCLCSLCLQKRGLKVNQASAKLNSHQVPLEIV